MIRTWMAEISALLEEGVYEKYYEQMPGHRKEKADRLRNKEDKARSIGAWILFQKMKKEYHLKETVLFNLSHSGNYVLCSVEDSEQEERAKALGCDLEFIREPKLQVAKRFFCKSEYERILENPEMFYRFWVLKESYQKATRQGMKLEMDSFEIGFSEKDQPYLAKSPAMFPEEYFWKEYIIEKVPYRIAVCADRKEFESEIRLIVLE